MPCNHKFQGHKNGVTCLLCGLTMSPEEYGVYLLAQAAPKAGVTATEAAEQLSQPKKPQAFVDDIKGKAVWAILAAFIAFILARVGL